MVVVESPFRADSPEGLARNLAYARAALADCVNRGEAPIASHLLFPQILRDEDPQERATGIECGLAWARRADLGAFYVDRGWSSGMIAAAEFYYSQEIPTEIRRLAGWE